MKYGASILDIKYKVNEKERTVKCTIICAMKIPKGNDITSMAILSADSSFAIPGRTRKVFTGVAKCHEDDHFSEVIGKRIAESRAKKAMYDYYKCLWIRILTNISASFAEVEYTLNQFKSLSLHEKAHIQKLIRS